MLASSEIKWLGEKLALYRPLDQVQSSFHQSQAPIRWYFGGNQSGKTHTNMMDLSMLLVGVHPYRSIEKGLYWCCIESWEQCRDILWEENLSRFIPSHHILSVLYGQGRVPRKVLFCNGSVLEFKAFNQGRELFQGRAVNSCYCDEQCHHDFDGILTEIQARLIRRQGFLSWSMTPIVPQSSLERRIEDMPLTDEIFYADLNANRISRGGYIPDNRIDDMIDQWPEEVQATRIQGRFASFYGAVYKGFSRAVHVVPSFDVPKKWRRYRGFDFGFTNPFVCLWMAQDDDDNWYVYREYYRPKTGIHDHIKAVRKLSQGEVYVVSWADPENAEDRAELKNAGIPTKAARKDIAKGIEAIQSRLKIKANGKPSLVIFNHCRNLISELVGYRYPSGSSSSNPKDIPLQKDDHACDALRYVIYSTEVPARKGHIYAA